MDVVGGLPVVVIAALFAIAIAVNVAHMRYQAAIVRPGAERPGRGTVILVWFGRVAVIATCFALALSGGGTVVERVLWAVTGFLGMGWILLLEWYGQRVRRVRDHEGDGPSDNPQTMIDGGRGDRGR